MPDDDFGTHGRPVIEIDDIVVHKPEAARGNRLSDRFRLIGAMDAVNSAAKVERASTERISGAARELQYHGRGQGGGCLRGDMRLLNGAR
jgi:hypothetical protein